MTAWIVLGVAVFWSFLLWRVKVERGNAHSIPRPMALFKIRMRLLQIAFGRALLPVVRKAADAMRELGRVLAENRDRAA